MPIFAIDGFNRTPGDNLTVSPGPLGATWSKVGGATADIVISAALRARGNANALARHVASGVPDSADYDVPFLVRRMDGRGEAGIMARADTAADTCYALSYVHSAGQWQLRRFNAGAQTMLGTFAQTLADGQDAQVRLKVRGTGATVTLRALVDGTERIAADDSAAGRITAVGRLGLRINAATATLQNTRSYHIARVWGFALPNEPRPRAPKPADGPLRQAIMALTDPDPLAQFRLRAAKRRDLCLAAWQSGAWQATYGGTTYTLSVTDGPRLVETKPGRFAVEVRVACSPRPAGFDPHIWCHQPSTQVPDGTVREEADERGEPSLVANFVDDALAGLRDDIAWGAVGRLVGG